MSYLQRKTIWSNGVRVYLERNGFDVGGRGKKLNAIMVEFLKDTGRRYVKWSGRYKGLNTADLINSEPIQENWKEFKEWVQRKVNEKDE